MRSCPWEWSSHPEDQVKVTLQKWHHQSKEALLQIYRSLKHFTTCMLLFYFEHSEMCHPRVSQCVPVSGRDLPAFISGMSPNWEQDSTKYWKYLVRSPGGHGLVKPSNLYHSQEQNTGVLTIKSLSVSLMEVWKSLSSGMEMVWQRKVLIRVKLFLNC